MKTKQFDYKKIMLGISLLTLGVCNIHAQQFEWARSLSGVSDEEGVSLALDSAGNVYTAGIFLSPTDFDPGPGVYTLNASAIDGFVSKLDAAGNFVWAIRVGGNNNEYFKSIAYDGNENIVITGTFEGTVDFDPGPGNFTATSNAFTTDIFILKLDTAGNFAWVKTFSGSANDYGQSVTVDLSGSIFTTGSFADTVDFDPGPGTYNLNSAPAISSLFILKLDASGNFTWAKSAGPGSYNCGWDIVTDSAGNCYSTGRFSGTTDFDPGPATSFLTAASAYDMYVLKLDAVGNFVWVYGGTNQSQGFSIALGINGNIFVVGGGNFFLLKLNSSGSMVSNTGIFCTGAFMGNTVQTDAMGYVYVAGTFSETAYFGNPVGNLTSVANSYDALVFRVNPSGSVDWAVKMGGTGIDYSYDLKLDETGTIYSTGFYHLTVDFDPGSDTFNLSSAGFADVYIHKMGQCFPTTGTLTTSSCGNATINNQTYTISGTYTQLLTNANGCDSVLTINLTILPEYDQPAIAHICNGDTYTFPDGSTSTSATTHISHFTSISGCDSNIVTTLNVHNMYVGSETDSICDGLTYIFPDGTTATTSGLHVSNLFTNFGCDSVIATTLIVKPSPNANIGPDTIWACDGQLLSFGIDVSGNDVASYTIMNPFTSQTNDSLIFTYNSLAPPAIVVSNVTGTNGCVSSDHITLMDNSLGNLFQGLPVVNDPSVTLSTAIIPPNTDFWYWSFGDGDTLSGVTNPTHTYAANGVYLVCLIAINECETDSDCYSITISSVGINEPGNSNLISVQPNPSSGIFQVDHLERNSVLFVYDVSGRMIITEKVNDEQHQLHLENFAKGMYTLVIQNEDGRTQSVKLVTH